MISPEAKQALEATVKRMRKESEDADDQVTYYENGAAEWKEKRDKLKRQADEIETILNTDGDEAERDPMQGNRGYMS